MASWPKSRGVVKRPSSGRSVRCRSWRSASARSSARDSSCGRPRRLPIVLMVIAIGWGFINPANHTPFIPSPTTYTTPQGVTHPYGGIMGILGAAGVVFFAFIGFDAVSTAAQEAKNPKRDMPIGILGSLIVCTILYILFAHVLTGIATTEDFRTSGKEASVAFAINKYMPGYEWLANSVPVALVP